MRFSTFELTGIGLLGAAWLVWAVDFAGDLMVRADQLDKPAIEIAQAEAPEPAAATETAAAPQAAGGALAMLAEADTAAGEKAFKKCKACHSTDKGGKNKIGPNLWNIVGQSKAGVGGYKYSAALTGLGGAWSYADLDAFLANPKGYAKGTKMSFKGVKKPKDRAAIIAYMRSLSDQPKPLP